MSKTILITGSTDGIGLGTAKELLLQGHKVIIHGRSAEKLAEVKEYLIQENKGSSDNLFSYICDLSNLKNVEAFAKKLISDINAIDENGLDVLINNAGVFNVKPERTDDGYDIRFMVNTIAPYLLTKELLEILAPSARVVNLSSAAQAVVELSALKGESPIGTSDAYAESKLAITMWNNYLASENPNDKSFPVMVAVNPKSFIGTKMVKEAYGAEGHDIRYGVDILVRAAISEEFKDANGKYFDNDAEKFALPHPDALNMEKCKKVVDTIEEIIKKELAR